MSPASSARLTLRSVATSEGRLFIRSGRVLTPFFTREQQWKIDLDRVGDKHPNLVPFIDREHIIIDILHSNLRIGGRFVTYFIHECLYGPILDQPLKERKIKSVDLEAAILQKIKEAFGDISVYFQFQQKKEREQGKCRHKWRDLTGHSLSLPSITFCARGSAQETLSRCLRG